MRPPLAAAAPLASALVWVVALLIDPGYLPPSPSALLVGIGLLLYATVATTGLLVTGARWALRLAWLVLGVGGGLAIGRAIDAVWIASVVVSVLSAAALLTLTDRVRKLPPVSGPPVRAVVLSLLLLGAPIAIGLTGTGPAWAALTIGIGAVATAFLYARVVFGGLIAVRLVWPTMAVALSPLLTVPGFVITVVLAGSVVTLAWHPSVKAAFHPPRTVGSTFPLPPELVPRDVLDAAGADDRGRRK